MFLTCLTTASLGYSLSEEGREYRTRVDFRPLLASTSPHKHSSYEGAKQSSPAFSLGLKKSCLSKNTQIFQLYCPKITQSL